MFLAFVIYLCVVSASSYTLNSEKCGIMSSSVGLNKVDFVSTREEFPWIAAVFMKTSLGDYKNADIGSLISRKHVVTKAHSISTKDLPRKYHAPSGDKLRIFLGTAQCTDAIEDGALMIDGVEKVVVHPDAHESSDECLDLYNIAIIFFKKEITFNKFIKPVCLKFLGDELNTIEEVYSVRHFRNKIVDGYRKQIPMAVTRQERCEKFFPLELKAGRGFKHFCAETSAEGIPGAADMAVFVKHADQWFLWGMDAVVITFDNGTAEPSIPTLMAEITPYVDWIETQLNL